MSLLKTGETNEVRAGSSRRSYWQDEDQIDVVDADDQLLTHTPPDGDIALSLLIDGKQGISIKESEDLKLCLKRLKNLLKGLNDGQLKILQDILKAMFRMALSRFVREIREDARQKK
ncbi:hypothetical protein TNCT_91271 [Trichonephila clavata]|uniref:Uncharacterized protein n=1 Tax=Trichonephila clavata TaxID=2740835 RepID=A0A8X6HD52_TRICU|nr:hypothetical protein TNCT_91271 [Trichonephila clavata]